MQQILDNVEVETRSKARPVATMKPLTAIVPLADFDEWFAKAPIGGQVIYATGFGLSSKNDTCNRARALQSSGHLQLNCRPGAKSGAHRRTEYLATKISPESHQKPKKPLSGAASRESQLEGTPEGRVLAELKRAANFDRPAPSLADLAKAAELRTRSQARYRLEKLVSLGLISIIDSQNERRVFRIISTGKTTREAAI